jgi:O-antigen/teichoic acid export membrane protein
LLSGGTALAQVLNFVVSPILTRIYSPEDYGALTVYTSILSLLIVFSTFFYSAAIPISEDDEIAINIVALCFIILFSVIIFTSILLIFWGEPFLQLINATELTNFTYFIPLGLFLVGAYEIFTRWALRRKDYKLIARTKFSQSIFGNATKLLLGVLKFGSPGLLLGKILDQSSGIVSLLTKFIKDDRKLIKFISIKKIKWGAKRYVNFLLYSLPNAIIQSFSSELPVIFLTSLYGNDVVGHYGLAIRVVTVPSILISTSIGEVFYGEAASLRTENPTRTKELSDKLIKKLILIGAIPTIILLIGGPELFAFVFSNEWFSAGTYARLLSLYIYAHMVFHPISRIYGIFEKQKIKLILDCIRFGLIVLLFLFSRYFSVSSVNTILIYSLIMATFDFLTYLIAQKILKNSIRDNLSENNMHEQDRNDGAL